MHRLQHNYAKFEELLGTSFEIFLRHAHLLEDDAISKKLVELDPGKALDITPPPDVSCCEWSICRESDPPSDHPSDFYLRGYELSVLFRYADGVVVQSIYGLIKDVRRNLLHYQRNFTRILEIAPDGEITPHLVSYGGDEINFFDLNLNRR